MLVNFLDNSFKISKTSGRNNTGKIVTYRRKKFKLKKKFKLVNLKRLFEFSNLRVVRFLLDPKKTSFLALVYFCDFALFSYVLSLQKIYVGKLIINSFNVVNKLSVGVSKKLIDFSLGSELSNISLNFLGVGVLARAAGTFATVFRKIKLLNNEEFVGLRLPSGVVVYVSGLNRATCGSVSNEKKNVLVGLGAKSLKRLGRRPRVRGVAMNPVDHPHGGGEGKTSGGRISVSRWGKLAKGGKTLNFKKKLRRIKFLKKLKNIDNEV